MTSSGDNNLKLWRRDPKISSDKRVLLSKGPFPIPSSSSRLQMLDLLMSTEFIPCAGIVATNGTIVLIQGVSVQSLFKPLYFSNFQRMDEIFRDESLRRNRQEKEGPPRKQLNHMRARILWIEHLKIIRQGKRLSRGPKGSSPMATGGCRISSCQPLLSLLVKYHNQTLL